MQMLYNMMNGNFLVVGVRECREGQHNIRSKRLDCSLYDHGISVVNTNYPDISHMTPDRAATSPPAGPAWQPTD